MSKPELLRPTRRHLSMQRHRHRDAELLRHRQFELFARPRTRRFPFRPHGVGLEHLRLDRRLHPDLEGVARSRDSTVQQELHLEQELYDLVESVRRGGFEEIPLLSVVISRTNFSRLRRSMQGGEACDQPRRL
nr:unnamed protein product [Callosobruchus chinensis]